MKALEALASGSWLTRERTRLASGAVLAASTLGMAGLLATASGTVDPMGRPLGTDFSNVWTAGRMALEGRAAEAYDWALHHAVQKKTHGRADIPFYGWHYPPLFFLVAAPLAALRYLPALLIWQALTLAGAMWLASRILPRMEGAMLAALAFPAVFICVTHGHNRFLTGLLLAGGLLALHQGRAILAGVLIGLLACKPQFGLLLPVVLAAGGHWRTVASAAVTVVAASLLTTALFGASPWMAFVGSADLTQRIVLEAVDTGWHKVQSIFSAMRAWGAPVGLAYAAQAGVTGFVLVACARLWRQPDAAPALRIAAVLIGALLSTPYVLDYDMVLLGFAIAFLAAHGVVQGFNRFERSVLALAWLAPLLARPIAGATLIPVGFMATAALFLLVLHRARSEAWTGAPAAVQAPAP